jgi:hypothetical protein
MITSNIYIIYISISIKIFYCFSCELFLDKFKTKCKNFGKDNLLLLFDILNYIVEQGNMNIWVPVSSKKFLSFILDILKSESDAEIQTKLLQLIQNWGMDFENKKEVIPNFYKIYNKFKINGVVFPPREESHYYKYITKANNNTNDYNKIEDNKFNEDIEENNDEYYSNENGDFTYIESIKNKLKASNFEHKYRRLVAYLAKMHDNIKIANIAIDKRNLNNLKEAINTIKKGNKTLIDTIGSGRLKDEKLMEITLGTTEDINQTLAREEEMKSGNKPNKFVSYFVLNEIIPLKNINNNRGRAKSEKKKINLNQRGNLNNNEQNNNNPNVKNVDDIFDLFSSNQPNNANNNSNFPGNMFNNNNNNQGNNMMNNNNFYSNQNTNNNNFMNNNNNFNNNDNMMTNNQINNNMNNNNFNQNKGNNQMNNIDLLQGSINLNNQQNNNMQNMNNNINQNKRYNPNEFDMYGPSPEINSDQLVHYMGPLNNNNSNNGNNNNQFTGFNNNNQNNNNMFSQNNLGNDTFGNNMGNNMGNDMNGNFNQQQMTQEEIEREQRLKELDDLF